MGINQTKEGGTDVYQNLAQDPERFVCAFGYSPERQSILRSGKN
jgi:hypothetical protein